VVTFFSYNAAVLFCPFCIVFDTFVKCERMKLQWPRCGLSFRREDRDIVTDCDIRMYVLMANR